MQVPFFHKSEIMALDTAIAGKAKENGGNLPIIELYRR
jgi:hypothetical protein